VWGGHSDYALKRVARLGDGWHPTQLTLEQLAQGKERLHQYCEQYGRDPDSVMIIARPGKIYQINAEILEKYRELGVHILVVDVPLTDRDLSGFRSEMQHIAEVGGLQLRG
jgi:alkanesulfonate monooxygenase SsuD/methylene tetrahydromethanopterin reductase-like flavin-dependent oxidoreductase (luciferase family)